MRDRFTNFVERLRANFWVLPSVMVILSAILAVFTIRLDSNFTLHTVQVFLWIYTGGAQGARALLSMVAGSMITVAGVTFSITIAALANSTSQFGPRLLRNFMRDTGNQITLGTFIATFMYCLLILRVVRDTSEGHFIPYISVTVAIGLAMASLGVLIYFIHHVSTSISAESVVAMVGSDLEEAIDRLYPKRGNLHWREWRLRVEDVVPENFDPGSHAVEAISSGYLQTIDYEALTNLAKSKDLIIQIESRPGHFIKAGSDLVRIWPAKSYDESMDEWVRDAFILGIHRLHGQDIELAVSQLVEVAVRALSPGINDPFTAMSCIDRLGVGLSKLAERSVPSAYRYDNEGNLRLLTYPVTFGGITDLAFDQIRQNGRSDVAVTIHLLETIAVVAAHTRDGDKLRPLQRQAVMTWRSSLDAVPEEWDREDIEERYMMVMGVIGEDYLQMEEEG